MSSSLTAEESILRVDRDRLWRRHMALAEIGAIDGDGNCRLALSAEDARARELFAQWCAEAGLELKVDHACNMFALRAGQFPDRPIVAAGSHLDTQPHGGRFDGISGVLAALEAIETLNDAGITTEAPLAVVNWTNEEGVRFAPGLLGSAWFSGNITDNDLDATRSSDGRLFAEEATDRRLRGTASPAEIPLGTFLELHIEQGPILEQAECQIGVVTSVQGLRWLDVSVRGMDGHAGTTPLDRRQDALLAAAGMLVEINKAGRAAGPDARVSVGRLATETDGPSTIVGKADFVIDIRHPDADVLSALAEDCARICRETGNSLGCEASVSQRVAVAPKSFDDGCVDALEQAARDGGYAHMRMPSGALHDASNIASVASTAMIFVPCRDGISHNVKEYASPEDLAAGATVLMHAMLARAGKPVP